MVRSGKAIVGCSGCFCSCGSRCMGTRRLRQTSLILLLPKCSGSLGKKCGLYESPLQDLCGNHKDSCITWCEGAGYDRGICFGSGQPVKFVCICSSPCPPGCQTKAKAKQDMEKHTKKNDSMTHHVTMNE